MRIDALLVKNGLATGRDRAKQMIDNGLVFKNGNLVRKASETVEDVDEIKVEGEFLKYVGRGGLKLEGAINTFDLSFKGLVCADIGASTGGFTDCMLQNGAVRVYALDVGHGQLADKLLSDKRVLNYEGINVKNMNDKTFPEKVDFVGADLSFISVKLAVPQFLSIMKPDAKAVVLIKPQFEAGKQNVDKGGIVKSKKVHIHILNDILEFVVNNGFYVKGLTSSPIKGGDGNIEYLLFFQNFDDGRKLSINVDKLVESAFSKE